MSVYKLKTTESLLNARNLIIKDTTWRLLKNFWTAHVAKCLPPRCCNKKKRPTGHNLLFSLKPSSRAHQVASVQRGYLFKKLRKEQSRSVSNYGWTSTFIKSVLRWTAAVRVPNWVGHLSGIGWKRLGNCRIAENTCCGIFMSDFRLINLSNYRIIYSNCRRLFEEIYCETHMYMFHVRLYASQFISKKLFAWVLQTDFQSRPKGLISFYNFTFYCTRNEYGWVNIQI